MTETSRPAPDSIFREHFGSSPEWTAHAPGRVNFLGAHVDYNDGWVLPGAIDLGIDFAAAVRPDRRLRLAALDLSASVELDLDDLPPPRGERPDGESNWYDVAGGVAWACREQGLEPAGLDVAFGGNLPMGAGISSSAALEAGLLRLWDRVGSWRLEGHTLAALGRQAENGYLGVGSGIMDQFASLHGRAGHLILLDCRTLEFEPLELPEDCAVLVLDSGVRRRLSKSSYNDRPAECASALARLREHGFALEALRDLRPSQLEAAGSLLGDIESRRVRHVVEECARVLAARDCLNADDAPGLGRLMNASHASSRDLYEVSIPELDQLAEAASAHEGCHGARLSGAGFGGCVTALVERRSLEAVAHEVVSSFEERFGRRPGTTSCRIADGARVREWR